MFQPFLVPSCMPCDIPQPHTTESVAVIKDCENDCAQFLWRHSVTRVVNLASEQRHTPVLASLMVVVS
jgi:hypothetical protein